MPGLGVLNGYASGTKGHRTHFEAFLYLAIIVICARQLLP